MRFKPWRKFTAYRDRNATQSFIDDTARTGERAFKQGVKGGPKTGRTYRKRGGRLHRASAAGEFPANDTGGLLGSINSRSTRDRAEIGSSKFYAKFLRDGTSKMKRRKMSDNALKLAMPIARSRMKPFARWKYGSK